MKRLDELHRVHCRNVALLRLDELGFVLKHGPEPAPGELHAQRTSFDSTAFTKWLRDAMLPKLFLWKIGASKA
jgi:hypothetical protein